MKRPKWLETPEYHLSKEDALEIKEFRKSGSWRMVAQKAAKRWPDRGYANGNQIEGMHLCEAAALTLGEDCNKEPWNQENIMRCHSCNKIIDLDMQPEETVGFMKELDEHRVCLVCIDCYIVDEEKEEGE